MMSVTDPIAQTSAPRPQASPTAGNLLAIAVFLLTFHVPGLSRTAELPRQEVVVESSELPRFDQVHSYFWRGAAPTFAGIDALKKLGVKTIVDLRRTPRRIEEEGKYCRLVGINYVSLPMGDFIPPPGKQKTFLKIVSDAAQNSQAAPVFLHCSHGSDRTGYLTALWRVTNDHWSAAEAITEMLQHGFLVHKIEPNT
ncbi:MAG: fused DSP-PTPase phosphatase/NAD kinase-like protein [Candidatus Saccharimonadales bacterium]